MKTKPRLSSLQVAALAAAIPFASALAAYAAARWLLACWSLLNR